MARSGVMTSVQIYVHLETTVDEDKQIWLYTIFVANKKSIAVCACIEQSAY